MINNNDRINILNKRINFLNELIDGLSYSELEESNLNQPDQKVLNILIGQKNDAVVKKNALNQLLDSLS